ncbi:MAG: hypothetical protein QG597_4872 [Actinomycetota bacterium]|nr:hypothetical protein [Actinomycetota bacterium]
MLAWVGRCHLRPGYPGQVDSLLRPVGPQPPSVYWKRRALVIGGLLLVIIALVLLWPSGGTEPANAGASPSPITSASPAPTASPSTTPSNTTEPSPPASPSVTGSAPITDCLDSGLEIATTVDPATPKVGAPVTLTMTIANVSGVPCTRDVGPAVNQFTITSGGYRVWSSDDCNPGGPNQIETIPPGQAFAVQATWPAVITSPGCPTPQQNAQPGTYDVVGSNADVTGVATRFSLTQ